MLAWLSTNPMGWATIAITAIGGVIFGMSKLSEAEKRASEKADELYEKSSTLVQQNKEEIKSLDTLISKYKELKEKGSLDLEDRNEIKGIQNDIADLVGEQAKNLDLVNGKLDAQIKKLDEISEKEAKRAYQQAQANYYNAKDAADKAAPTEAKVLFTNYDYAGKIETEARKALEEAGFGYYNDHGKLASPVYDGGFGLDGIMGSQMVVKAAGETAQEKYDYLQKMISTLEQYGQRNTEIYRGLVQQAGEYGKYINQQQSSIESLMDSWAITSQYSNQKLSEITVDSVATFVRYRKAMIKEARKDETIGQAMEDGILSHEDIVKSVNDFMATTEGFSEWYVKWQESMKGMGTGTLPTLDLSEYKDQIDNTQSSITTLRSALESLNKGELDKLSVIDLLQEFPSLAPYIDLTADGFGNLSEGLSVLIEKQPAELIQKLNELKDSLSTDEERKQVDLLIDSLQRLSSYGDTGLEAYAGAIGNTWDDTENVIDSITTQFENLAKVQETVAKGLTMTTTKAAELAKMYPEILTNAKVSANGQITLNNEVVKSVLAGDQSIVNAQIAKLEADKAELEAKKTYAEAKLDIIKQVGEGEGKITKETAQYAIETAGKELKALIDMGNEQDKAYAEVAANMAANMDEYNRIVAQVAEDTSTNMTEAAASIADTIDKNMRNAQESVNAFIQKTHDMADAIRDAKSGVRSGSLEIHQGGGSTKDKEIKTNTHTGNFNATLSEYAPEEIDLDDFQSSLEIDIQNYADAISNIDAQIEVLKNLQATFENNGGIGGHGYTDKIKQLEKEKEAINNAIKPDKETTETFNWIETLLSRVQRTIKTLGNTVSSTWKNWTTRNSALTSELSEVRKEIELQKSAYDSYKAKADSINLSGHYKELIRNGALSIEDVTDDTLKEQIKEYKEYYEKALDCKDAVSELKDKLAELAKTKFDHISAQYDAKIQDIDHMVNLINGELEKAEELNQIAGNSFYEALISNENSKIESLTNEYKEKLEAMNEAVSSGSIQRGSEAWQGMKSDIDSVTESIQEANNQILKYENSLKDIAKLKFDSLETQFDSALSIITTRMSQLDKQIALVEEAGHLAGESFYNAMIESEKTHTEALIKEYESLSSSLKEAMENGSVTKFDETWYDMTGSLHDVEDALLDAQTALIKYSNSLRELKWDVFDRTQESISGITQESDFLIDFMEKNNKLHNENGTFNDRGLSVQGLHAINYDIYLRQAEEYANAIKEINGELANDPNNTKLQDRYKELLNLQREAVLSAEDEKSAIKDLISEGYDKMLSFLDKLISARKKALSEEKSLHDYEKTIAEQTAEVSKYQKILDAYKGDDSEGMKATIQKAQESLTKAQEELNETEYDKYLSDQEALLDTFRTELEEWVNLRLDDINGLLQQAIEATNANAQTISGQINTDLTAVGMTLTESLAKIFEIDYSGGMKEIVSGFFGSDGNFSTAMTTVNTAIGEIKAKSDEIKVSTDQVSDILNQRFPELTQSMPSLTETNNKITDVTNAIGLVKEAITAIHTDMAKLELDLPDYGGNNDDNDDNDDDNDWNNNWNDNTPPAPATPTVSPENNKTTASKPQATVTVTQKPKKGGPGHGDRPGLEVEAKYFYKNGVRKVPEDQLAETQEDGTEYILSPSRGGMITPLRKGDGVMTAEQSERLFQLSQLPPDELRNLLFPDYVPESPLKNLLKQERTTVSNTNTNNDVTVNITIPNITNKDELMQFLRSNESTRYIVEAVSNKYLGKNSYRRLRY